MPSWRSRAGSMACSVRTTGAAPRITAGDDHVASRSGAGDGRPYSDLRRWLPSRHRHFHGDGAWGVLHRHWATLHLGPRRLRSGGVETVLALLRSEFEMVMKQM